MLLNTVTERHQAMFFELVENFPEVGFLMRWKGPLPKFLEEPPKNLMVSEWLPQREILSKLEKFNVIFKRKIIRKKGSLNGFNFAIF